MTPAQRAVYDSEAAKAKKLINDSGQPAKVKSNVMMDLRKAAIHPLLFRRHFDDKKLDKICKIYMAKINDSPERNESLVREDLAVMTDFELNRWCGADDNRKHLSKFKFDSKEYLNSGKVKRLVEVLRRHKENGDRTLVFSQFVMVMDILDEVFEIERITYSRLDGSTKMQERQELIDQFYRDEDIQVFMLSTGAGGAGINLACANKVIIFGSSFNPHQDAQAENRAHRVGQKREVEVIKLIMQDTIEEQIQALGRTKLALDERVAGEDSDVQEVTQAENEGMSLVEELMFEQHERKDVKDEYMEGLKSAGLNVL